MPAITLTMSRDQAVERLSRLETSARKLAELADRRVGETFRAEMLDLAAVAGDLCVEYLGLLAQVRHEKCDSQFMLKNGRLVGMFGMKAVVAGIAKLRGVLAFEESVGGPGLVHVESLPVLKQPGDWE